MFNELFSQAIEKSGWSQNYISKTFNINRGLIYKYMHGELLIPKATFLRLLEEMKITRTERDIIFEQYYREAYGDEKFKILKYLENTFNGLDEFCKPVKGFANKSLNFDITDLAVKDFMHLNSENDILGCVDYILKTAVPGEIITNYPYTAKKFDDMLFNNMIPDSNFSVLHMLTFDKGSDTINNLNNIFSSIRWLQYGINPVYCYENNKAVKFSPYPYYFAVDSYCVLFSTGSAKGIFIKSDPVFADLKKASDMFKKQSLSLAIFPRDIFEFKNEMQKAVINTIESNWSMYPCLSAVADEKFITSIIRTEVPGIEMLAKMAIQHYEHGLKVANERYIVSALGLRMFAETGKIHEVPSAFVHEAPPAQRIRFLKKLIELSELDRLMILDDSSFLFPEVLCMDLFENVVQISGMFENIDDKMKHNGNFIINIDNKSLRQDFEQFKNYICESKYFYSKHTTKSYIDSLIILCENLYDNTDRKLFLNTAYCK